MIVIKEINLKDNLIKFCILLHIIEDKETHLLQFDELNASPTWQIPFQEAGIGSIPISSKLSDSGHTPNHIRRRGRKSCK